MSLPLNIDPQQILLHLFNLAILVGGLYILLYKPVKNFINKREEHYKDMDRQANEALEEANLKKTEYDERMHEIDREMDRRIAEAEKEIDELRAHNIADAEEEAARIVSQARTAAERLHNEMLDSLSKELKDMAVSVAEKALIKAQGDPYEDFLNLAERSMPNEQSQGK